MNTLPFHFVVAAAVVACGGASAPSVTAPSAAPSSRYRVGDFVVYRYSGSFSAEPVTMREEVTAQEGLRLRIDVSVTRGAESRRWVQIVTDTKENEANNVLDALYEWQGDKLVKLANEKNADILRLSSWVMVEPDGHATDVAQSACKETVSGSEYACTCTDGKNQMKGAPISFHASDCAAFLWTHASASFRYAGGKDVLRVEVVESGHRDRAAEPLAP